MNKILVLFSILLLPILSSAQVVGKNQVSLIASHVPATTTSESLFSLTISTVNTSGVTLGGASVSMYTISAGKSLNITNLVMTVESGGSAPVLSRVDFKIRISSSPLSGDCSTSSPIMFEEAASSTGTLKNMTTVTDNPGLSIYGNGKTTLCFTQLTPDWTAGTNVSSTTISLNGYEL